MYCLHCCSVSVMSSVMHGVREQAGFSDINVESPSTSLSTWVLSKRKVATSSPGVTATTKLDTLSWSSSRSLSSSCTHEHERNTTRHGAQTAASLTVLTAALWPCSQRPTRWSWSSPAHQNVPKLKLFFFTGHQYPAGNKGIPHWEFGLYKDIKTFVHVRFF